MSLTSLPPLSLPFAALGARISGVDDCTYSSTGESFSTILLPESESIRERELQADDVSLAYGELPTQS